MKSASLTNKKIQVQFTGKGEEFRTSLTQVRSITGRKYDPSIKSWWLPLNQDSITQLINFNFTLDNELLEKYKEFTKPLEVREVKIKLKKELYPYQKEGLEFVNALNGRALIGDEMGLGKTAQAIAYLELHPQLRPAVIVCPASLKYNWQREIDMWTGKDSKVISGKNGSTVKEDITIINYDILKDRIHQFTGDHKPKVIILDECHAIKNPKAIRTKAVQELCKGVQNVIALSGTPIINRPIEFFNVLNLIAPNAFPSRWSYAHKYCDAKHTRFGWDMNGSSNLDDLNQKLSKVMIRRKKEDVLKDLPAKTRSIVPIELSNKREYEKAKNNIIQFIREREGAEKAKKASNAKVLVAMEKLKQLAVEGKMKEVINWINDFLDSGQKLVIFATHKKTLDLLEEKFKDISVRVDGGVDAEKRQERVVEFQSSNNKIKLFLGNMKAAGVGITLTASSNTCFVELGWTPGDHIQAEDRVHRIGQKDNVTAHYLIAKNSIEEDVMSLLEEKGKILDQVLDGASDEGDSIFSELLNRLN